MSCKTTASVSRDSEEGSDVIFLLGIEPHTCRIPAHKSVLAAASPVFRVMFEGVLASGPEVSIPDVDRRAFDNLLRYAYGEGVPLQSVSSALMTLYAAHKYQCESLERLCLSYVQEHVDDTCVLDVYHDMLFYNHSGSNDSDATAPSAPLLDEFEDERCAPRVDTCYKAVLDTCLRYIDTHADAVLAQEQLEELSEAEVASIACRDSLALSSEGVLFEALRRWCTCRCKCSRWPLTPEHLRQAMGARLLFCVRFLTMDSREFVRGPMASRLLTLDECRTLLELIDNQGASPETSRASSVSTAAYGAAPAASGASLRASGAEQEASGTCQETTNVATPTHLHSLLPALSRPRRPPPTAVRHVTEGKKQKKKKRRREESDGQLCERKLTMVDYFWSCIACVLD